MHVVNIVNSLFLRQHYRQSAFYISQSIELLRLLQKMLEMQNVLSGLHHCHGLSDPAVRQKEIYCVFQEMGRKNTEREMRYLLIAFKLFFSASRHLKPLRVTLLLQDVTSQGRFFFNADLKSSRLSNSPQKFTKNSLHLP